MRSDLLGGNGAAEEFFQTQARVQDPLRLRTDLPRELKRKDLFNDTAIGGRAASRCRRRRRDVHTAAALCAAENAPRSASLSLVRDRLQG